MLSAYGSILPVHEITGSLAGGVVAAVLGTYAPWVWTNIDQLHVAAGLSTTLAWFALARLVRTGAWRWAVALGCMAAWQVWASLHWGVFLALGMSAGVPVLLLLSAEARRALPQIAVAAALAGLLAAPLALPYAAVAREMDLTDRGFVTCRCRRCSRACRKTVPSPRSRTASRPRLARLFRSTSHWRPVVHRPEPERLTVDLGSPARVSGIDLGLGYHFRRYPWTYRVEGSTDGAAWSTLAAADAVVPPFESYRADATRIVQRLRFPPTTVRLLRVGPLRTPPEATIGAVGANRARRPRHTVAHARCEAGTPSPFDPA